MSKAGQTSLVWHLGRHFSSLVKTQKPSGGNDYMIFLGVPPKQRNCELLSGFVESNAKVTRIQQI